MDLGAQARLLNARVLDRLLFLAPADESSATGRDSPVRFAVARTDVLSHTCMRRILSNISVVTTLFVPA